MSTPVIKSMVGSTTDAPEVLKNATDVDCPHCKTANARSAPHSGTIEPAASRPGSRIHCDLTGKLRKSIMGYNYLIVFVCEHTRYVFRLHRNHEILTFQCLHGLRAHVLTLTRC